MDMEFEQDLSSRKEWKGKNTYHADCSNPDSSLWGFETFDRGTVGMAILDWFINVWTEIDCPEQDLADLVFNELNFYINNETIAKAFRDAWLKDYQDILYRSIGTNLMAGEEYLVEWIQKNIAPFINKD